MKVSIILGTRPEIIKMSSIDAVYQNLKIANKKLNVFGVPCVTLRDSIERPETLEVGSNTLSGGNLHKILQSVKSMVNKENSWINPFGEGKAGKK